MGLAGGLATNGQTSALSVATTISPSGDTTGATDTPLLQDVFQNGGQIKGGTYYVNATLAPRSSVTVGAISGEAIIQAVANLNAPLVKSQNFDSLTLTGDNTAGIHNFHWRGKLVFDGNKANQASTAAAGVQIYGFDFDIENLTIRNCKATDGLYTEFGALGSPGPDLAMEAYYKRLRVHDNTGNGWHHRGPHDSHFGSVLIHNNGGIGYWAESPTSTTITAGSNGVDVSAFAGAGTLNIGTTVGHPTAGALTVATGNGNQTVTYTGKTGTTFTGCSSAGTGVMSTGGSVTSQNAYSGTGMDGAAFHVWGSHAVGVQCDNSQIVIASGKSEGASVGQVWLRAGDCSWIGGKIFATGAPSSYGLRIGDASSGYTAANNVVHALFGNPDFAGAGTSTASVWFDQSAGNRISGLIHAGSGTTHIVGTLANSDVVDLGAYGGATRAVDAGNSKRQLTGGGPIEVGASTTAATWRNTGTDYLNLNTSNKRIEAPGGQILRGYSDAYSTTTFNLDANKGHIGFGPNGTVGIANAGGVGSGAPTPTLSASSSDTAGEANFGTGTGPTSGAQVSITFAQTYTTGPIVVLTPGNAAAAALGQPYVTGRSATSFQIAFPNAPAASQAAGTYVVEYVVIARGS